MSERVTSDKLPVRSLSKPFLSDKVWQQIQNLNHDTDRKPTMNSSSSPKLSTNTRDSLVSTEKTIDDMINWSNFDNNFNFPFDEDFRRSIRSVICRKHFNFIFITYEDQVYCFGWNNKGFLGLGDEEHRLAAPVLNTTLSGKQLIDVCSSFTHCIGLTKTGECYAWGDNSFGQLGIGSIESQYTPQLIDDLLEHKIVQICCGSNHSLALTSNEEVYAWGNNTFGQLGDGSYKNRIWPTRIRIVDAIAWISCGQVNSLALTDTGRVWVWGINQRGQLGRPWSCDLRVGRDKAVCNKPTLVSGLNCIIKKAVSGPDHTLLLSEGGRVYAFGMNDRGQVGVGSTTDQFKVVPLNNRVKIKDIISCPLNKLSLAISEDNRHYVWGLVQNQRILRPKLYVITDEKSVFDIYLKCVKYKVLFKTLDLNEDNYCFSKSSNELEPNLKALSIEEYKEKIEEPEECHESDFVDSLFNFTDISNQSILSNSTKASIVGNIGSESLKNRMIQAFNNPNDSDIKFVSEDKVIYCQKSFLAFRNKKFWQKVKQHISEDKIFIDYDKYEIMEAFVKYLYGYEPELSADNVLSLQSVAIGFDEKELLDHCIDYIRHLEDIVSNHRKSMLAINEA